MAEQKEKADASSAPAPAIPAAAPASSGGNSMKVLLIVVVTIVVTLAIVVGGFFGYKVLGNSVKKEVNNQNSSSTSGTTQKSTDTTTNTSTGTDKYSTTKDIQPATDLGKQVDKDVRAVLTSVFGGVKLENSFTVTPGVGNMIYVTKRVVTANDGSAIESGLVAKGYTKVSPIISETEGFVIDVRKTYELNVVANLSSDPNTITVVVTQ